MIYVNVDSKVRTYVAMPHTPNPGVLPRDPRVRPAGRGGVDTRTVYVVPVEVFILGSDRGRRLRGRWNYSNLYLSVPRPYPRTRSLSLPVPEE